mmetsp:Transcript_84160/g.176102  ORF Transcript_84160/g.176102 Transcript_84160/m.176102 type:complete len:225 (+) Transcript_84160:272-946(+)
MQTLRNRVSVDTIVQIVSREEGIFLDAKASASSEEIRDVLALFERRAWSVDFGDGVRPDLVDQEAQDLACPQSFIEIAHDLSPCNCLYPLGSFGNYGGVGLGSCLGLELRIQAIGRQFQAWGRGRSARICQIPANPFHLQSAHRGPSTLPLALRSCHRGAVASDAGGGARGVAERHRGGGVAKVAGAAAGTGASLNSSWSSCSNSNSSYSSPPRSQEALALQKR